MADKPTIAIVPTGGTIQNGLPFVTSSKAGGPLNVLRAQRLHEPVTVRIRREDRDGNPLADGGGEFHEVTLTSEDGLYLLPYMETGHEPAQTYSQFHLAAERVIEEIDRFSVDTNGRNGLLSDVADLRVEMVIDPDTGGELRRGGETFSMRELVLIANTVNETLAQSDVNACIVTHGTFTTEETAAFLNYTVNSRKPVVVAASQRRHGSIGNDGDWNLWDAVRVAASPDAAGKGVVVILDEQIFPARDVTKTNQRPGGFASLGGSASAIGSIEADQVSFYFAPTRLHTAESRVRGNDPLPLTLPTVDIVKTYAGADDVQVRALIDRAIAECEADTSHPGHGIVVEGFAYSGVPHRFQRPALEEAVRRYGIPVVLTSRGLRGRIPKEPTQDTFITGDNLSAVKARLLLTLAIRTLGPLTPFADADNPTQEERERLLAEIGRYQQIFDTH